jgi:epsilon-lactone hydrolase
MPSAQLDIVLAHMRAVATFGAGAGRGERLATFRRMVEMNTVGLPGCGDLRTCVTPINVDGLAAEWHVPPGADESRRVLYIHGGGWMGGSLSSHRSMVSHLAAATGRVVLAIDYRLAPEHPFPAGLEDCVAAFAWLQLHGPSGERNAASTVIAGDSAGGNLTLATLLALKSRRAAQADAAVALSPVVDLSAERVAHPDRQALDPVVDLAGTLATGRAYVHGATTLDDPLVSPLNGDLAGLPPLLLQAGAAEVLVEDSTQFAGRARAASADVTLEVFDAMPHVFQAFAPFLPEANDALDNIATFLDLHS